MKDLRCYFIILFLAHCASASAVLAGDGLWRTPDRDGLNCLYLQMRASGSSITYNDLSLSCSQGQPLPQSLTDLSALANRFGAKLSPALLTNSDLDHLHIPIIVHLEDGGLGTGRFCLFLGFEADQAHLINGSDMTRFDLPRSRFTRVWSGYALALPPPPSPWPIVLSGFLIGFIIVLLTLFPWVKPHFRRQPMPANATLLRPSVSTAARINLLLLVFAGIFALCPTLTQAAELSLPADLLKAQTESIQQLNAFAMEWRTTYEVLQPRVAYGPKIEPIPPSYMSYRLQWSDGSIYLWRASASSPDGSPDLSAAEESASDGAALTTGSPHRKSPEGLNAQVLCRTWLKDLQLSNAGDHYFDVRAQRLAGYIFPSTPGELVSKRASTLTLWLLEHNGSLLDIRSDATSPQQVVTLKIAAPNQDRLRAEQVDLVKYERELRSNGETQDRVSMFLNTIRQTRKLPQNWIYKISLNPDLHYAVTGWSVSLEDGRLLEETTCSDFKPVANSSISFPRKIISKIYAQELIGPAPQPIWTYSCDITNTTVNPPQFTRFKFSYSEPGTQVSDNTLPPDRASYTIPASAQDLEKVNLSTPTASPSPIPQVSSGSSFFNYLIIIAIGCAVVVLTLIFVRRKWAKEGTA